MTDVPIRRPIIIFVYFWRSAKEKEMRLLGGGGGVARDRIINLRWLTVYFFFFHEVTRTRNLFQADSRIL